MSPSSRSSSIEKCLLQYRPPSFPLNPTSRRTRGNENLPSTLPENEDLVFGGVVLGKERGLLRLWLWGGYDLSAASKERSSSMRKQVVHPLRPAPLIYLPLVSASPTSSQTT
jgi:hypothetical protein